MRLGMIDRMTRLTLAVPDELAAQIRAAADGNVSGWLADVARKELLREEAVAVADYEARRARRDADAEAAWESERFGYSA